MNDPGLPIRQVDEYVKFGQNELFFHLVAAKDARINELKKNFAKTGVRKIYISGGLGAVGGLEGLGGILPPDCNIKGINVFFLEKDFFRELDPTSRKIKKKLLDGCIVIINNNDLSSAESRTDYPAFFSECDSTFFVTWDFDNHHWLELSTFLATFSDIYAPSHHENLYLLSRYNWLIAGPVYCSAFQWSRKFLTDHLPQMLLAERSDAPLGMHGAYAKFSFRMQIISMLNQHYPSIGFSNHSFHFRSAEDRLAEWYSHKAHWIAPVLNDVPIRIFDALVTGGIPIVPSSLRLLPPVSAIPREHITFYSPADIINPEELIKQTNELFDEGGRDKMVERHRFALQYHHGETSILQMLSYVADVLDIKIV